MDRGSVPVRNLDTPERHLKMWIDGFRGREGSSSEANDKIMSTFVHASKISAVVVGYVEQKTPWVVVHTILEQCRVPLVISTQRPVPVHLLLGIVHLDQQEGRTVFLRSLRRHKMGFLTQSYNYTPLDS